MTFKERYLEEALTPGQKKAIGYTLPFIPAAGIAAHYLTTAPKYNPNAEKMEREMDLQRINHKFEELNKRLENGELSPEEHSANVEGLNMFLKLNGYGDHLL